MEAESFPDDDHEEALNLTEILDFYQKDLRTIGMKDVSFTYYPAGHMFYMLESCVEKFHGEAAAWYGANE